MKATFIDCYIQNNEIILWLKQGKRNIKLKDYFIPELYITGKYLKSIQSKLKFHRIKTYFTKKRSFFNGELIYVLKVPIYQLSNYKRIIKDIEKIMNYDVELHNADMKLEEVYMFQKDIFPTCIVDYKGVDGKLTYIKNIDDANKIDYKLPNFSYGKLRIETKDNLRKSFDTKLMSIIYKGNKISGKEDYILNKFKKVFELDDPDIIWTDNGNLILPYLREKYKEQDIRFNFNRFEDDDFEYKAGQSYWTYSQIVYRTNSIFLKGRLHFDTKSFFADDTGFHGIIDGSRISRQRIQRTEMRSAGACVTNYLLYMSFKNNYLLPYKIGMYERFKTLGELYEADRGSVIFEPRVGFHTDVVEFDFISLYPQIMWKQNLSPETLFCKCCKENKVPDLHYNFCKKKVGIVSQSAKNIIERRIKLKKKETLEAKEKSDYLKWLLVTMFGYQAFKNKKIGTIEIHESIQAYARQIIMKTVRIAEELGWETIHGIIDGVYLKKRGYTKKELKLLQERIISETGYLVKLEGCYRWIVFLPSIVNENQPVSNHFYGVFENGELKCRGIEARRNDYPIIVGEMQTKMINSLSKVKTEEQFVKSFPRIMKILKSYLKYLPDAKARELKIVKRVSKINYVNEIAQKLILDQLEEAGWHIHPGQRIEFIIRDVKNKNPKKRYISLENYDGKFDIEKYKELMIRATYNLIQPFGVSLKQIQEENMKIRQMKLSDRF